MSDRSSRVPLNFCTGVFYAIITAQALWLCGGALGRWFAWTPPTAFGDILSAIFVSTFLLLPVWTIFAVRPYPVLQRIGLVAFLLIWLTIILTPAMATCPYR